MSLHIERLNSYLTLFSLSLYFETVDRELVKLTSTSSFLKQSDFHLDEELKIRVLQLQSFVSTNYKYTRDRKILSKAEIRIIQIIISLYCSSSLLSDFDTDYQRDTCNSTFSDSSDYSQE